MELDEAFKCGNMAESPLTKRAQPTSAALRIRRTVPTSVIGCHVQILPYQAPSAPPTRRRIETLIGSAF
jgi:hypothetical protein